MSKTADRLRELYDSAPNARLILAEGDLVLDMPKKTAEDTADDVVVVVLTRNALLERLSETGNAAIASALEKFAPVVDDLVAKLGA